MNCQELNKHIDDYIEDGLSAELASAARIHVKVCDKCQHRVNNRILLKNSLVKMPVPKMRADFADQVIQNAIQDQKLKTSPSSSSTSLPKIRWGFAAGFTTALVASFAIWFFVNTFSMMHEDTTRTSVQALNIELHESKTVKLVFNSPQAMQNATVSLELPQHIEIEGYAQRRSLTWSTHIKAGKNILSLPVRALGVGNGELVTKVEFGGKSKMIRFNVNVNQAHQSKPIETINMPLEPKGFSA